MKSCVIALSFGTGTASHGAANEALAVNAAKISQGKIPVIAQWEIAENLEEAHFFGALKSIKQKDGKYLDSRGVLISAKEIMKKEGYGEAILVAHQKHLPRVKLIASKLTISFNSGYDSLFLPIPFPKHSEQWWTRNNFLFMLREIPTLIYHKLRGWT